MADPSMRQHDGLFFAGETDEEIAATIAAYDGRELGVGGRYELHIQGDARIYREGVVHLTEELPDGRLKVVMTLDAVKR